MAHPLKAAIAVLILLTAIRLVVAAWTPLAPDEAYYWVWSHDLQWGYLDAPPMVAWWIRVGTLIAGQGALGVRLLAPVSAALGSVLMYQAAQALIPGTGLLAAGTAERHAAVQRRRGTDDARYAAAVLLGVRAVGGGDVLPRPQ